MNPIDQTQEVLIGGNMIEGRYAKVGDPVAPKSIDNWLPGILKGIGLDGYGKTILEVAFFRPAFYEWQSQPTWFRPQDLVRVYLDDLGGVQANGGKP